MARSSVRKPRGTTLRQDPKLQSLLRDSVDEIVRRSRGAANGPRQGQCAQLRKIDNFLPSRQDPVSFFRKSADVFHGRPGLWHQDRKMARKWRRNRLKSLKTDSETASRRLAIVKGPALTTLAGLILGGLEAQPRWLAPRALPRRPSRLAHWSLGGARTRCFRLLPCVRGR